MHLPGSLTCVPRRCCTLARISSRSATGGACASSTSSGKGVLDACIARSSRAAAGVRRLVAVKIFGSVASEEAEHVYELAARTATRAACIRHPNVVEVYDSGSGEAQPYFVDRARRRRELADAARALRREALRLPLDLALFIACEIAEALSGARTARDHRGMQLGMLHLALGARKVLLGWRGEVKVSDFETSDGRGRRPRASAACARSRTARRRWPPRSRRDTPATAAPTSSRSA